MVTAFVIVVVAVVLVGGEVAFVGGGGGEVVLVGINWALVNVKISIKEIKKRITCLSCMFFFFLKDNKGNQKHIMSKGFISYIELR